MGINKIGEQGLTVVPNHRAEKTISRKHFDKIKCDLSESDLFATAEVAASAAPAAMSIKFIVFNLS